MTQILPGLGDAAQIFTGAGWGWTWYDVDAVARREVAVGLVVSW
jgi:hypothetical protein